MKQVREQLQLNITNGYKPKIKENYIAGEESNILGYEAVRALVLGLCIIANFTCFRSHSLLQFVSSGDLFLFNNLKR